MSLKKVDRVQAHELIKEAQIFLSGVRNGRSEQDAGDAAGVTLATARAWLRDEDFAYHYELARRGEGGAQILTMANVGHEPTERQAAVEALVDAREEARLTAQERQADAALDEYERQQQLGRYVAPEADLYGRLTDLKGWLGG